MSAPIICLQPARVQPHFPHASPADASNMSAASTSNAAATVGFAADTGGRGIIISEVHFSYNGTTIAGNLQIGDGTPLTYFNADITQSGYHKVVLNPPLVLATGKSANVTLAAGGAGVTGKIAYVNAFRLK